MNTKEREDLSNANASKRSERDPDFGTNGFNEARARSQGQWVEGVGPELDVVPVGLAVAEALQRFHAATNPVETKRWLKDRILLVCRPVAGEPVLADWVAGAAADLVVRYDVPLGDLDRILLDISAMREAGGLRSPPGLFHKKARALAERHGKPWPRKSGTPNPEP